MTDTAQQLWERAGAHAAAWQQRVPRLIAFVRVVYLPVAIVLLGYLGYRSTRRVDLAHIRVWFLVLAYLTALAWWLALAAGWSVLVTERLRLAQVRAWCTTQVMRYLPGGIWAPVARATTVQGRVRDKAAAVLAENVTVLAASTGVAALWVSVHSPQWLPLVLLVAVPLIGSGWLERRTRVTRTGVVRTTGIYSLGYVAYGFTGIFCQLAVSGVRHPTYPLYVAGAACLAWAVGLVVVFAPGGVGVREVVYIWMLRHLYPRADLQAAAVSSRLVTILAELTVLAVIVLPWWRAQQPETSAAADLDTLRAPAGVPGEIGER